MTPDFWEGAQKLKLYYLQENHDMFFKTVNKQKLTPLDTVSLLVTEEVKERQKRSTESRLRAAKIGKFKPMDQFDWSWPEDIPREAIERLFSLNFITEPSNIVMVSTSGLGKTMIAKNLAYEAALSGHNVLFVEASEMMTDLQNQDSPTAFRRRLAKYTRPALLVLDEVGYMSYDSQSADLLFQIINRRYEKTSTIVTTNKPFKEWGEMFPGAACVTAMIDRLTHHAEIIAVKGNSFRRHEASKRKQTKGRKADGK